MEEAANGTVETGYDLYVLVSPFFQAGIFFGRQPAQIIDYLKGNIRFFEGAQNFLLNIVGYNIRVCAAAKNYLR